MCSPVRWCWRWLIRASTPSITAIYSWLCFIRMYAARYVKHRLQREWETRNTERKTTTKYENNKFKRQFIHASIHLLFNRQTWKNFTVRLPLYLICDSFNWAFFASSVSATKRIINSFTWKFAHMSRTSRNETIRKWREKDTHTHANMTASINSN